MRRRLESTDNQKISPEEVKYLWDNDPGDVNEKVLKMDDEYAKTGMHRPAWGKDSEGEEREVIVPKGKLLDQYAHDDAGGSYFAPKDTPYEKLELNDSQDKRKLHRYEVLRDMPATESKVARQPWNREQEYRDDESVTQYKTSEDSDKLIRKGYLKEVPIKEEQ